MADRTETDAITEAAVFLLELVETDLLPIELNDDARQLAVSLQAIARELDGS